MEAIKKRCTRIHHSTERVKNLFQGEINDFMMKKCILFIFTFDVFSGKEKNLPTQGLRDGCLKFSGKSETDRIHYFFCVVGFSFKLSVIRFCIDFTV